MTAPTITKLPPKARAVECWICSGEARYLVQREGERDVKVCCWCRRKFAVVEGWQTGADADRQPVRHFGRQVGR